MNDSNKGSTKIGIKTSNFFIVWLIAYGIVSALIIEYIDLLRASLPFDISAFWWIQTLILGPVIIHELVKPLKRFQLIYAIVSPVTGYIIFRFVF